jgi:hypothetical protein
VTELPQAADAEKIVLGSMMVDPEVIPAVVDRVSSRSFSTPANAIVFANITAAWAAGEPVEPVALMDRMLRSGDVRQIPQGPAYLHDLVQAVPVSVQADYYAAMVTDAAERRDLLGQAAALAQAAQITEPEIRARRVAEIHGRLIDGSAAVRRRRVEPLVWDSFLSEDFGEAEWLAGKLIARGQQLALVGAGKAGKSLFSQEWAWRMAAGKPFLGDMPREPVRVVYIDQENDLAEIQTRLMSFGATAADLGNLAYLSYPAFRPLDTEAGAADLLAAVQDLRGEVVFFDTISRMISGKENDSEPWLSLYRFTIVPLKRARITGIRLDHFGKDEGKGARGNSAKTQDVDHVWELKATERGASLLQLVRTHTRSGLGEGEMLIERRGKRDGDLWVPGGTGHGLAADADGRALPTGWVAVQEITRRLDAAGVPSTLGRETLRQECVRLGIKVGTTVLADVAKHRKERSQS